VGIGSIPKDADQRKKLSFNRNLRGFLTAGFEKDK